MIKMSRICVVLLVLVSGCMLDPLGVNFTADVDGKQFQAVYATWQENPSTSQIIAVDVNLKMFTISIPGNLEEGTYVLGLVGSEASAIYIDILQQKLYVSQSGILDITSKTSEGITGTFDMVLMDIDLLGGESTQEVTNGVFDLPSVPDPEM